MTPPGGRLPVSFLAVLLAIWEPITFALYASSVVARVADRGWLAILLLIARVVVTAIGIAAGLALWRQRPWALRFARTAVLLSAAATLLTVVTGALPTRLPPGTVLPWTAAIVVWDLAWVAYLTWILRGD